jgi:TatD DNase family protein
LIDLHCHVDLYPDPVAIIDEAERRGTFVLAVTTTPKAWRGTTRLVGQRRRIRVGLGLHPEVVAERHGEVALLCGLLPEARYVGEIGIDGSPAHRRSLDLQRMVFGRILAECDRLGGRILSIHSRGAADMVLDAVEAHPGAGLPILHWFSGTPRQLERAVHLGCWFSVGPAMVRSAKGRALVSRMPPDRLLTETDAPFARVGDRPLYPWEATDCAPALAEALGVTTDQVLSALRRNLQAMARWTGRRSASLTLPHRY